MRKLQALTDHIKQVSGIPQENIWAFYDDGVLVPTGQDMGPLRNDEGLIIGQQIELGIFEYNAVIEIERYPGGGHLFMGLVTSWLADYDHERDGLEDPSLSAHVNSGDGTSDLQLAIGFKEIISAIEDECGDLPFNGKRWKLHEPVIIPAEELERIEGRATDG